MTNSPETFESPVIRSSVTPSLKYSWVGSWLRFENGSTATDGLSGNGSPADSEVWSQRHPAQPPAARRTTMAATATTPLIHRPPARRVLAPVRASARARDGGDTRAPVSRCS